MTHRHRVQTQGSRVKLRACLLLHWAAVRVTVDSSSPELLSVNWFLLDHRGRKGRRREGQRRMRQGKGEDKGRKAGRQEEKGLLPALWRAGTGTRTG